LGSGVVASYCKPVPSAGKAAVPLTSIVSSYLTTRFYELRRYISFYLYCIVLYLAYMQLILKMNDNLSQHSGCHSVASSEGQQAVCLFEVAVLRASSAHPGRQHRWSVFPAIGICSSSLIQQGCPTSFCVISCWQIATGNDSDRQ